MVYLPVILRATLFLCCLALAIGLRSQSLLDRLAEDVCDCMGEAPEIVYPRIQASRCVDKTAERYGASIRKNLQLEVESAADRRQLAELLIDPLTADCPLLQDILSEETEAELHYSDYTLLATGEYYRSEKQPPADPVASTSKERPSILEATGILAALTEDQLELRQPSGRVLTIEYQSRQIRNAPPTTGEDPHPAVQPATGMCRAPASATTSLK